MDTAQPPPAGLDPLLSVEDLAAYLDVPRQTIYDWRVTGRGPRAYRVGKRLRFTVADVRAWLQTLADAPDRSDPTDRSDPSVGPPSRVGG